MSGKSPSSQTIDHLLSTAVAPGLKGLGFRRQGRSFWRPSDDLLHCVHFQASQWNNPQEGRFTANLLVVWPVWHHVWTGTPMPKNPSSAASVADQRVGWFMPERGDFWWTVHAGMDTQELGGQVTVAVERAVAAFFPSYPYSAALLARLEGGETLPGSGPDEIVHAVLLASMERQAEALKLLDQVRGAHPEWSGTQRVVEGMQRWLPTWVPPG